MIDWDAREDYDPAYPPFDEVDYADWDDPRLDPCPECDYGEVISTIDLGVPYAENVCSAGCGWAV